MSFTENQKNVLSIEQIKAIKSLERAFKKCDKLGITFAGLDDSFVWSINGADDAIKLGKEVNEDTGGSGTVDTECSYLFSGGW